MGNCLACLKSSSDTPQSQTTTIALSNLQPPIDKLIQEHDADRLGIYINHKFFRYVAKYVVNIFVVIINRSSRTPPQYKYTKLKNKYL